MVVPPRCGVRVGYRQSYGPVFRKKDRAFFLFADLDQQDLRLWLWVEPEMLEFLAQGES